MSTTTIVTIAEANAAARKAQTATLSRADAWGQDRSVTVTWRPQRVDASDTLLNVGKTHLVWADSPPCHLSRTPTGGVELVADVIRVVADTAVVVEGQRVRNDAALRPGTFVVVADTT